MRGNRSRTTQVVHRRDVAHCSTCKPYYADAEMKLDDSSTQWGGGGAITRFTLS